MMKYAKLFLSAAALLTALLLAGCRSGKIPEDHPADVTQEPAVTEAPTPEPTAEPTAEPTEVPEPTATPEPTAAPEPTEVPEEVHFYSPHFEAAIRRILHKNGEPIYMSEILAVKKLELNSTGLFILNDLSMFKNLEVLSICSNGIEDISAVASLTKLKEFRVVGNRIRDYSPIAGLTELRLLTIGDNSFPMKDTSIFNDLTKLEYLELRAPFSSDLSFLSGMKELKDLSLFNAENEDCLRGIENCVNLEDLYVHGSVKDVSPLAELKCIRSLSLWIEATDYSPLAGLDMLEDLSIICPPNSELGALSGLEKLTKLTVCRSGIKDISFVSGMKRLTDLNLSENEITDLTPLYGLERLADLSISDNPLTVEQVEELRAKLPGCNVRFRIDD